MSGGDILDGFFSHTGLPLSPTNGAGDTWAESDGQRHGNKPEENNNNNNNNNSEAFQPHTPNRTSPDTTTTPASSGSPSTHARSETTCNKGETCVLKFPSSSDVNNNTESIINNNINNTGGQQSFYMQSRDVMLERLMTCLSESKGMAVLQLQLAHATAPSSPVVAVLRDVVRHLEEDIESILRLCDSSPLNKNKNSMNTVTMYAEDIKKKESTSISASEVQPPNYLYQQHQEKEKEEEEQHQQPQQHEEKQSIQRKVTGVNDVQLLSTPPHTYLPPQTTTRGGGAVQFCDRGIWCPPESQTAPNKKTAAVDLVNATISTSTPTLAAAGTMTQPQEEEDEHIDRTASQSVQMMSAAGAGALRGGGGYKISNSSALSPAAGDDPSAMYTSTSPASAAAAAAVNGGEDEDDDDDDGKLGGNSSYYNYHSTTNNTTGGLPSYNSINYSNNNYYNTNAVRGPPSRNADLHHPPDCDIVPKFLAFVEFKRHRVRKYECDLDISPGLYVMVDGDRGRDCGLLVQTIKTLPDGSTSFVCMDGTQINAEKIKLEKGRVLGIATTQEIDYLHHTMQQAERVALETCRKVCDDMGIKINLQDCEYQFDMEKVSFYFNSEHSVDFRPLVRELYRLFRVRIWMENTNPHVKNAMPMSDVGGNNNNNNGGETTPMSDGGVYIHNNNNNNKHGGSGFGGTSAMSGDGGKNNNNNSGGGGGRRRGQRWSAQKHGQVREGRK